MEYNFKKYTQVGKKIEKRMTITRTGHIGLPTQFYKDNKIDDYRFAVIYYDEDAKTVGVKFTKEQEDGALLISKNRDGYGGYLSAKNFFRLNNIPAIRYARRYAYDKISLEQAGLRGDGFLFVIRLTERASGTDHIQRASMSDEAQEVRAI